MIKLIKKFQIKLTPFDATKIWAMSNINNDDLLLHDSGSYLDPEVPVALEFIDYGSLSDSPSLNYECNIALEQQEDDLVNTRIGLKKSGLFLSDSEPINTDKTYKRMVYAQINTMFYNNSKNPTQTWGINNIDFELSRTKRKISDEFKLFDIPKNVYGDKIIPKSVILHDYSTDDNFDITDDGYGNLLAGSDIFSKVQVLGEFNNEFTSGIDFHCEEYWRPIYGGESPIVYIDCENTESFGTTIGYLFGSIDSFVLYDNTGISSTFITGGLFEAISTGSNIESGSVSITFISGSILSSSVYGGISIDSSSFNITFLSGSIDDLSIMTSSYETGSLQLSFVSSSIYTYAIPSDLQTEETQLILNFYEGTRSIVIGGTGYATSSNGTIVPEP